MKKNRIAVVGCGALAKYTHLPNIMNDPELELQAVCDVDLENMEYCKKTFGAKRAEADWRKIIEADDIDLCVLATHQNFRGEFIVPALEHGKPVYTEKPLAPSIDDIMKICRTAQKTQVPVCVGHNRRSSPAMLEFKRLVAKAQLDRDGATAQSVTNYVGSRNRIPEENASLQLFMRINDDSRSWKNWVFHDREGIMFAEMVHFIDLALWLNTATPVRIMAEGSPRGNFTLLLRFSDGSLTTMVHSLVGNFDYPKELFEATSNYHTVAMDQHFEVRQVGFTDEPTVQFFPYAKSSDWANDQHGMAGYFIARDRERERAAANNEPARWLNVEKGHHAHLANFVKFINGATSNPCPVESAVAVNRIALKALESARTGYPLVINPEDYHLPE